MKISLWVDTEGEKQAILDLTKKIFGDIDIGNSKFFDWQYRYNPNGKAIILLARDEKLNNILIGTNTILPIKLIVDGEIILSSLACNVQVHPNYRKQNIFSNLLSSMPDFALDQQISSLFAIPNDNSFKAFINEGSIEITRLPLLVKPIKLSKYFETPLKNILKPFDIFWKNTHKFSNVEELTDNFDETFENLARKTSKRVSVMNNRTKEFLNWRYKNHPTQKYQIFILKTNHKLIGYIITKIHFIGKKKIGVILDYMVDSNHENQEELKNLIFRAISNFWDNDVSIAIATSRKGLLENKLLHDCGFFNAPSFLKPVSLHFVVQIFNNDIKNRKLNLFDNWFFAFGDYDIF
tara:strand:- start:2139 stop:3191 length:1053 start_codon:yes stop_codon:yes gene_type:complete